MTSEINKAEQAPSFPDKGKTGPRNDNPSQDGDSFFVSSPDISLPKGGGAISGISEKFTVNAVNGTAALSIPLPVSVARGFSPALALGYNSGSGNGVFGLGWSLKIPSIKRKTEKELPQYFDAADSDTYILSEAEDLVAELQTDKDGNFLKDAGGNFIFNDYGSPDGKFRIRRYRPRIEGLFSRIERWTELSSGLLHWRILSKDNITSLYGAGPLSRIADPQDDKKIFEWCLEYTYDDKGNGAVYEYKQEDGVGLDPASLHNKNRVNGNAAFSNTYLKRIRYGNTIPWQPDQNPAALSFMFETVFDYGEHDLLQLPFAENKSWYFRPDAFSDYRAGFEIRTCRLCHRVLLYHHFKELPGGSALVRSLQFGYDNNGSAGFTFLQLATQTGYTKYDDGTWSQKSFPPFEFAYQPLEWNDDIQSLSADDLWQAPSGLDAPAYQFIDLYSEGLSGILTQQANAWFYKSNLGNGHFTPARMIGPRPSLASLPGDWQILDLEADGNKEAVCFQSEPKGFFGLGEQGDWQPFIPFAKIPSLDFNDPNLRLLDLNADGKADLLITEYDVFTLYLSEGKKGFSPSRQLTRPSDEEKGAAVLFSDSSQSIFLADMSGDGLTDIVRIQNGEVCYWPNLGYGRFGARISMDNAPVFDHPDSFDPSRIRLSDIDGSGTTDLIYLGKNVFSIWLNQQGNGFLPQPQTLSAFPPVNNFCRISVLDLLGNGVAAIVWNSNLPQHSRQPLRYIDLLNRKKPHLLLSYKNNLGKEVQLDYRPSTSWYLQDQVAGTPWITKLPFPVHCVSKVTTLDRILQTSMASTYSYHHGYYDHTEREFRGFGRIDQQDSEDFGSAAGPVPAGPVPAGAVPYQPPVTTRTWFHTGASLDQQKILHQYGQEYNPLVMAGENLLPDPLLPADLPGDQWQEAFRSCKGMLLRKEIYCFEEGTAEERTLPYSVEQHNGLIRLLQPRATNKYAVFLMQESEAIHYYYERQSADPRISHSFTFDIDKYGNPLGKASVVYARKPQSGVTFEEEQGQVHILYDSFAYTNDIDEADDYRIPLLRYNKTYEVRGIGLSGDYFLLPALQMACESAADLLFQEDFTAGPQRRIIKYLRTAYRDDAGTGTLPFGILQSKALVHQSYQAAFTDGVLNGYFSGNPLIDIPSLTADLKDPLKGGYVFADDYYWIPSGTRNYDTAHFYLSTVLTDPFGNNSFLEFDPDYSLFVQKNTDAMGNVSSVRTFNYRVLAPLVIVDKNDNLEGLRFDELGMVASTFVLGKEGQHQADEMDGSKVEWKDAADQPTTTMEYSVNEWYDQTLDPTFDPANYHPRPNFIKSSLRESFYNADPAHAAVWHVSYSYSDGGGHEISKKIQAEPGIAFKVLPDGSINPAFDTGTALRWVGTGRVILDNKGNPVKQYEPYFSADPSFDDEKEMVQLGITPVLHYDALGRLIRTEKPNGTFTRVGFTPWIQYSFDENDTVKSSDWYIALGSPDPANPAEPADSAVRAAWLAAADDNTPTIANLDTLGRVFLTVRTDGVTDILVRTTHSIDGNLLEAFDSVDSGAGLSVRPIVRYSYDMAGHRMKQVSMDSGNRWMVNNCRGLPFRRWDDRLQLFSSQYDPLRRLVRSFFTPHGGSPVCYERIEYTDNDPTQKTNNLNGKLTRYYDQSGLLVNGAYDVMDNLLHSSRQPAVDYKTIPDWTVVDPLRLQSEIYTGSKKFNALRMPLSIISPNTPPMLPNEILPSYNDANLLVSVAVKAQGSDTAVPYITAIHYNASGQRTDITYGNDVVTKYIYEDKTFRLSRLTTRRASDNTLLQDLSYVYDPVGNIMQSADAAQKDLFFDNEQVQALNKYTYDALYRLTSATGRQHAGQNDIDNSPRSDLSYFNFPFKNNAGANEAGAFRNYREQYSYDRAGNMLGLDHIVKAGGWTRGFAYGNGNNQLTQTTLGAFTATYSYDPHGNLQQMEQLQQMTWNFNDQLAVADLGGGGKAYYTYDAAGQRTRKVIERLDGSRLDRLYLAEFEVYREYDSAGGKSLERESLHIMDSKERVALVETKTAGPNPSTLIRYQLNNHLGSSCIELDEKARQISYEEYFPFGATSYYGVDSSREVPAKRYRYTRKERDEESGLGYHGARYYCPWLCRWTAADKWQQKGESTGNRYVYVSDNPIVLFDPTGFYEEPVHGATTYRLALAAGFTQEEAAQIAIATAGMDHDPSTRPGDSVGEMVNQIFLGRTQQYHFPSQEKALADVEGDIARGANDMNTLGQHLHSLEDVGFKDASGPHDRGPDRLLSPLVGTIGMAAIDLGIGAIIGDTQIKGNGIGSKVGRTALGLLSGILLGFGVLALIFALRADGVGHPSYETEIHQQSNSFSHVADEAFQDPVKNNATLQGIYSELKKAADARHPGVVPNDKAANEAIDDVIGSKTADDINHFLNRPITDNAGRAAPTYVEVVRKLGRWKVYQIDVSVNDHAFHPTYLPPPR